jgi:hypothetical protein
LIIFVKMEKKIFRNNLSDTNRLRDYSTLFTRKRVIEWLDSSLDSIERSIKLYDKKWANSQANYLEYLKYVYYILEEEYANEYIYKNSFINEWLISELGKTNAIILNEFRIGKSITDLAMFNGTSKAFEIKSDLDSETRLSSQIIEYQKVFNETYIIVPEVKLNKYNKISNQIGIITYHNTPSSKFTLYRKAKYNLDIDALTIMNLLHTAEYKAIIKSYFGELPKTTSFTQFQICKELLMKIPKNDLNYLFIESMKQRKTTSSLSTRYYKEFNQLSLALKLNKKEKKNLIANLKQPINTHRLCITHF